jgi:hypothetical protein
MVSYFDGGIYSKVRSEVLTVATMKTTVFWDMVPCSVRTLMMEAVHISETSAYSRRVYGVMPPDGCHLHKLEVS